MEINERAHTHTETHTDTCDKSSIASCELKKATRSGQQMRLSRLKWTLSTWLGPTHLANAGANRQRATGVKHGVYVIFDSQIESWTSNRHRRRHRLLPLGSPIFVCCQMLLTCHAPNCNDPLTVRQGGKRVVFQFTTRTNMSSEFRHQLNSSVGREFILITSSGTRLTPGNN